MSDLVKCEVCGREFNFINNLHLKVHKITVQEYLSKFPDTKLCSNAYSENMRNKLTGNHHGLGLKRTDETKQQMRDAHLGKIYTPMSEEGKANIKVAINKYCQTDEHKAIMSEAAKVNWQNSEYREHSTRSKIAAWQDAKKAKNMLEGRHRAPNDDEILVGTILEELFPNQYKFVGDLSFWIEQINPDFIDNNNKRIIEYNGCYYHNCPLCGEGTKEQQVAEAKRIATKNIVYNRNGYSVLVIWTHDFYDADQLERTLIEFNNSTEAIHAN